MKDEDESSAPDPDPGPVDPVPVPDRPVRMKANPGDLFNRLVDAYRLAPGVHHRAAQWAKCDAKTARRFWEGANKNYLWALPIRDLLDTETRTGVRTLPVKVAGFDVRPTSKVAREAAAEANRKALEAQERDRRLREAAAVSVRAEQEAAAAARLDTEARLRGLQEEARKLDDQTLRVLRSNTLGAIASQARVVQASAKAGARIADMLERGVDAKGDPYDMTPVQFAAFTNRLASTNRHLALAAESIVTVTLAREAAAERSALGTDDGPVLTSADVEDDLRRVRAALDRVRAAEELVVSEEPPAVHLPARKVRWRMMQQHDSPPRLRLSGEFFDQDPDPTEVRRRRALRKATKADARIVATARHRLVLLGVERLKEPRGSRYAIFVDDARAILTVFAVSWGPALTLLVGQPVCRRVELELELDRLRSLVLAWLSAAGVRRGGSVLFLPDARAVLAFASRSPRLFR